MKSSTGKKILFLLKNSCFVRHMFRTTFVPLSAAKVLKKHVRYSSYLVLVFFKENSHSHGKFTERLFLLKLIYTKFLQQIDRKINKIYQ